MASSDMHEPDVHPVALVLPWYVTGTLSEHERREADEHLAACASCRAELAGLQALHSQVREACDDQPAPDTLRAAKARIRQARRVRSTGSLAAAASALRALFSPTWVPAAALGLILVQFGLLVWMTQRTPVSGELISRGIPSAATRLQLVFQPTATEQEIRRLLLEARARLVGGPSREGAYIVEIPTSDRARIEQKLDALKGHPDVVRSAERAPP